MIRFLLVILQAFKGVFTRSGVNFQQMTEILRVRLTVDDRISKNLSSQNDKSFNNALLKQGISLAVVGSLSFLMPLGGTGLLTALLFFHCMILMMFILSFLSEYSQSLFDTRDAHILLRLPVDSRTISSAKILAVGYYMFFLTFCGVLIPFFILLFKHNLLLALSLVIATFLNTFFALLLTNLLYMACMRFTSGEKFKKMISYLQIILIVITVGGYQLLAQDRSILEIDVAVLSPGWYAFPPLWFTAISGFFLESPLHLVLPAVFGLLLPLFSAYITFKWFAPYFMLHLKESEESLPAKETLRKKKEKCMHFLKTLFIRDPLEKEAFVLSWRLASGNTKFKEAILPTIAYVVVMFGITFFAEFRHPGGDKPPFSYFLPLYFTLIAAFIISSNMGYNSMGNMLWIYQSKPLRRPGILILGAFKAVYLKYFLPIYIITAAIVLFITGISHIDDILFILGVITLITLLSVRMVAVFPFSREKSAVEAGGIIFKLLMTIGIALFFGIFHFILTWFPGGVIAGLILVGICLWFTAASIRNISWQKIEHHYR